FVGNVGTENFASFGSGRSTANREFFCRLVGAAICERSHTFRRARVWTGASMAAFSIGSSGRTYFKRSQFDRRMVPVPASGLVSLRADCACVGVAGECRLAVKEFCAVE